jgi:hypothetical protein
MRSRSGTIRKIEARHHWRKVERIDDLARG